MTYTKTQQETIAKWAANSKHLVDSITAYDQLAITERVRVDAYTKPLVDKYKALLTFDKDVDLTKVNTSDDLIDCKDTKKNDKLMDKFYDEKIKLDIANGWTGADGCCPALVADTNHSNAKRTLVKEACVVLDIEFKTVLYSMKNYKKMITMLINLINSVCNIRHK